jgi:hypothetical protein
MKDCYEQLNDNKLDNLKETQTLPKNAIQRNTFKLIL